MARLMVDDDDAFAAWEAKLQAHVNAVLQQRGITWVHWFIRNDESPADREVSRALVQAYHEGVEGLRKRGH